MTLNCDSVRASLEIYALGALDDVERAEVERHLAECDSCSAEADALAAVAHELALLPPPTPVPAGSRERLLSRLRVRQTSEVRQTPRRWRPTLAAVAAVVAIASLAWAFSLQLQLQAHRDQLAETMLRAQGYDRIVAVLSSKQLHIAELLASEHTPAASGRIVVDRVTGTGMLMVWKLKPVSEDRAYQVWFVSDSERKSGGVVRPGRDGNGYFFIQIPPDLHRYQAIGLTEEPAAGSPGPTGERVLSGAL